MESLIDIDGDEDDDTIYECPGLAPPGEMEVTNPFFMAGGFQEFQDDLPPCPVNINNNMKHGNINSILSHQNVKLIGQRTTQQTFQGKNLSKLTKIILTTKSGDKYNALQSLYTVQCAVHALFIKFITYCCSFKVHDMFDIKIYNIYIFKRVSFIFTNLLGF